MTSAQMIERDIATLKESVKLVKRQPGRKAKEHRYSLVKPILAWCLGELEALERRGAGDEEVQGQP